MCRKDGLEEFPTLLSSLHTSLSLIGTTRMCVGRMEPGEFPGVLSSLHLIPVVDWNYKDVCRKDGLVECPKLLSSLHASL